MTDKEKRGFEGRATSGARRGPKKTIFDKEGRRNNMGWGLFEENRYKGICRRHKGKYLR
jgi:hypothetical protein